MKELGVDIETFSSVDLTKAGVHRYVESPDFEIMLFQWSEDGGPAQHVSPHLGEPIPPHIAAALVDPAVTKTAWGASFERTCLAAWLMAEMPAEQWRCTMVAAATLGLPLDLDRAGRALKIKNRKHNSKAMRFFCIPCKPTKANGMRTRNLPHHDPALWREFLGYGDGDVDAEQEIKDRTRKIQVPTEVAQIEQEAWCLDQRTNDRGVKIDLTLAANAVELNAQFKARCHAEAVELTGLKNPNSVKQLIGWLNQAEDLDLEELKKKMIPPLLQQVDSEVTKRVLNLRMEMAKTSTQKYVAMLNRACADGHFRGGAQFYGAKTGRWAHRGVQFGNLPHNVVADILEARRVLRDGDYETLENLWGVPSFILSQLIRTAFIPDDEDSEFLVVDFSAIEAVKLAWLADCKWRLDVFRGDGKIYEHSASRAFKVPWSEFQDYIDRGKKHPLRPKGKVIELACGYGGSEGALVAMGALEQGLTLEELRPMAYAWRDASPEIAGATWRDQPAGLWELMNDAALGAVRTGRPHEVKHGIEFTVDKGILFMRIPSGRKLAYMQPRIVEGKFGQPCIEFSGIDQKTNQWTRIQTYGPKLCLAEGTPVLTRRGWAPIETVTGNDEVWDGDDWVPTDGMVYNGQIEVVEAYGALATADHQFLTGDGWKNASQSKEHQRADCRLPDGYGVPGKQREEEPVGSAVHLRGRSDPGSGETSRRGGPRAPALLRLQAERDEASDSRDGETPRIRSVEEHERSMPAPNAPGVEELRRTGDPGLHRVAGEFRNLLGGHGRLLPEGADIGTSGQRSGLLEVELHVGDLQRTGEQSTTIREVRRVYDLVNCGPRHRFTIWAGGAPLISHNCENADQASCRDLLRDKILRIDEIPTYRDTLRFTVHDEGVWSVKKGKGSVKELEEIFAEPVKWAPGLPLNAAGFATPVYCKEIE